MGLASLRRRRLERALAPPPQVEPAKEPVSAEANPTKPKKTKPEKE